MKLGSLHTEKKKRHNFEINNVDMQQGSVTKFEFPRCTNLNRLYLGHKTCIFQNLHIRLFLYK